MINIFVSMFCWIFIRLHFIWIHMTLPTLPHSRVEFRWAPWLNDQSYSRMASKKRDVHAVENTKLPRSHRQIQSRAYLMHLCHRSFCADPVSYVIMQGVFLKKQKFVNGKRGFLMSAGLVLGKEISVLTHTLLPYFLLWSEISFYSLAIRNLRPADEQWPDDPAA